MFGGSVFGCTFPSSCPPMEFPFSILRTYNPKFVIQVFFWLWSWTATLLDVCTPRLHCPLVHNLISFRLPHFSFLSTDTIILLATQAFNLAIIHILFEPLLYPKPGSHTVLPLFSIKCCTNILSLSTASTLI